MSYDEHLISMAGGDGDPLESAEARVVELREDRAKAAMWRTSEIDTLLALVRTQQATLAAVLNLANTSGRCGWRISADELRRTLRGES